MPRAGAQLPKTMVLPGQALLCGSVPQLLSLGASHWASHLYHTVPPFCQAREVERAAGLGAHRGTMLKGSDSRLFRDTVKLELALGPSWNPVVLT